MRLATYRSLWGYPGSPVELAESIGDSSYDGIEGVLRQDRAERRSLVAALESTGARSVLLVLLEGDTPREQLEMLRADLAEAAPLGPDRIVAHSGRDFWPLAETISFYEAVVELEAELGLRVAHETHRGRPLATPWTTAAVLEAVPELGLCCDFSHWVVVCERMLEDQGTALELAARHALHVHARVGTIQAPQVVDPADPGVAVELAAFEGWWDLIWDAQEGAGVEQCTLTPEYGPPPYQPLTASQPVLSERLAAICDWQARRAKERFDRRRTR